MNEILRCLLPIPDLSDVCLYSPNWKRIFRGGVRIGESATYFSRPTPPIRALANDSMYDLRRMYLPRLYEKSSTTAIRLVMRRIMAAYTNASPLAHSLS